MTFQNIQHVMPLHRLANALERMKQNIADQRNAKAVYDKTFSDLSAMSPRDLNDIGIDRADIAQIATQAAAMK